MSRHRGGMSKSVFLRPPPGQSACLDDDRTTRKRTQDILTEAQLAAEIGVTPRTLRLWRHTRTLPHIKLTSKVIRYRRADIASWLERKRVVIG
jgi:DNA-binding XRE family transcriptional regulator